MHLTGNADGIRAGMVIENWESGSLKLINAERFIKRCEELLDARAMHIVRAIADEEPDACDLDGIMGGLEELRRECEDPMQDYCPDYFIDRAEEIVRNGMVVKPAS